MKKVMLLGAGSGQMPFLKICKEKGYYVIVVSIDGNYPCFKEADKSYHIDTRDKDKILDTAMHEKIDAIITDQTDVSVPTVAYVAEKMGLRGIGYQTSLKFTDKYEMRKAAREAGINVPDFGKATTLNEAKRIANTIGFPLIIKPTDSSGSRGVFKIENISELCELFEESLSFSLSGNVILEQFIHCDRKYIVNGFAMNYNYTNLDVGEKKDFDLPSTYITKQVIFLSANSEHDDLESRVLNINKKLVLGMGLEFGITHADYFYNSKDNKFYLGEVASRGGGTYISSDLTPLNCGFNSNEAIIKYVVEGIKTEIEEKDLTEGVSSYITFGLPSGIIKKVTGLEKINIISGVYRNYVSDKDVFVGKETKLLSNDSEKYGPIIITASDKFQCNSIIKDIKNTLKIDVLTKNGIEGIVW